MKTRLARAGRADRDDIADMPYACLGKADRPRRGGATGRAAPPTDRFVGITAPRVALPGCLMRPTRPLTPSRRCHPHTHTHPHEKTPAEARRLPMLPSFAGAVSLRGRRNLGQPHDCRYFTKCTMLVKRI